MYNVKISGTCIASSFTTIATDFGGGIFEITNTNIGNEKLQWILDALREDRSARWQSGCDKIIGKREHAYELYTFYWSKPDEVRDMVYELGWLCAGLYKPQLGTGLHRCTPIITEVPGGFNVEVKCEPFETSPPYWFNALPRVIVQSSKKSQYSVPGVYHHSIVNSLFGYTARDDSILGVPCIIGGHGIMILAKHDQKLAQWRLVFFDERNPPHHESLVRQADCGYERRVLGLNLHGWEKRSYRTPIKTWALKGGRPRDVVIEVVNMRPESVGSAMASQETLINLEKEVAT